MIGRRVTRSDLCQGLVVGGCMEIIPQDKGASAPALHPMGAVIAGRIANRTGDAVVRTFSCHGRGTGKCVAKPLRLSHTCFLRKGRHA